MGGGEKERKRDGKAERGEKSERGREGEKCQEERTAVLVKDEPTQSQAQ